jgi:carboxyl-terminal processing protease
LRLILRRRTLRGAFISGLALATLSGAIQAQQHTGLKEFGLTGNDPRRLDRLEGVWRSRGYGWIWSVRGGRIEVFDESGDLCLRAVDIRADPREPGTLIEISRDGRTMAAFVEDDAYRYTFDRIDGLPQSCGQTHESDPQSVLEAAINTMATHYPFFPARNIDWTAAVDQARHEVTTCRTDKELFTVLSRLLSHFADSHVNLQASVGGAEVTYDPTEERSYRHRIRAQAPNSATFDAHAYWTPTVAKELLGSGSRTAAGGEITYGLIDGRAGYLRVDSMEGYPIAAADKALSNAVRLFRNAKAVFIDVSLNDGGRDAIARRIAGFFAPARIIAYSKRPGDAKEEAYQTIPIEPSKEARYTGPIYLIAGPNTVSAGEIFVLAMRALPNVTQIGEPTDGSLSDELLKPLPNRWILSLSNEIYLDANGLSWEGSGIPPEIALRIKHPSHASRRDVAAARRVINGLLAQHD